jgi:hypothetical protein
MAVVRRAAASRDTAIAIVVTSLALVAMAFDHLVGDDAGLDDPVAFAIAAALTLATAVVVFGVIVPRARSNAERAATRGLVLSVVSFFAITVIWLGVTFVLAGGAVALGLTGLEGRRRRLAIVAIGLGTGVLVVSTVFSDWTSST